MIKFDIITTISIKIRIFFRLFFKKKRKKRKGKKNSCQMTLNSCLDIDDTIEIWKRLSLFEIKFEERYF